MGKLTYRWNRRVASWEIGFSLFLIRGDYVRFDLNLGWWSLVVGRSFRPREVLNEN